MDDRFRRTPSFPAIGEAEELAGTVESIIFRNEKTGYTVCSVRVREASEPVTVVGHCATIWVGERLRATGTWVQHRRHGCQFQADTITCIAPTSAQGIERYLASGILAGVGKVMARRIVEKFGERTLTVIEQESQRLEEVEGIGPTRRRQIRAAWMANRAIRDIMIFLQSHGVGMAHSARIFRTYGPDAIALITEDPYRLCRDIWGIGFKTADRVARSIGVPPHSERRAQAGLVYALQSLGEDGHCFAPEQELLLRAQTLLDIPRDILADALQKQVAAGQLVREDSRVYLPTLHTAEVHVANKMRALYTTRPAYPPIRVDRAIAWAEQRMRLQLAPAQVEALRQALTEKITIITGGPGVGKTTLIRALTDIFTRRKLRIHLAAPTGRAAKRMTETTGYEAQTLHRLLKYQPRTGRFEYGPDHPLPTDVVVVDEVSMVDLPLMSLLLSALPDTTSLILVGDSDQLPSVGPGNVLHDLIQSGVIPCCRLETIFRQKASSAIVYNAHRINRGEPLDLPDPSSRPDFYFIAHNDPNRILRLTVELVRDRVPREFGFDPVEDIQVLTPMRRNSLGSDNLNALLQDALNPAGITISRFGRQYRVGDRVMQMRNNYEKDVFNGDIGRIRTISEEEQRVWVDFDGTLVCYEPDELDELMHAYACTIHKAQGSEYPAVVIVLATQHFKLLQRNLLYTAVTRARELVCLIGSWKAAAIAIRNHNTVLRHTTLAKRLCQKLPAAGPVALNNHRCVEHNS